MHEKVNAFQESIWAIGHALTCLGGFLLLNFLAMIYVKQYRELSYSSSKSAVIRSSSGIPRSLSNILGKHFFPQHFSAKANDLVQKGIALESSCLNPRTDKLAKV